MRACGLCGLVIPLRSECPRCGPRRQKRRRVKAPRQARGYDQEHYRTRARLLPAAFGTMCPLCGEVMLPGQDLHLDHTVPLSVDRTARGDRIVHARCNLRRGDGRGGAALIK